MRQMLTAWIPHPRAVGSERNWGQEFNIALKANGLDTSIKKLTDIQTHPRGSKPPNRDYPPTLDQHTHILFENLSPNGLKTGETNL